jgi:hypothetical protein
MSFKNAFLVVLALHVVGYIGITGLSHYKQAKRKELAAEKEKWNKQVQTNLNTSNDWPGANKKPIEVASSPKKEDKTSTQSLPIKREEIVVAPIEKKKPVKTVAPVAASEYTTHIKIDEKKLKKVWADSQAVVAECVKQATPVQKNVEQAIETYRTTVKEQVNDVVEYVVEEIVDRQVISSRIVIQ